MTQDHLAIENEQLRKTIQLHAGDAMSLNNELDEWRSRALAAEEALANATQHRDMIIELCATRAQQTSLPQYGTDARHTGREEARKKIVENIRRLKSPAVTRPECK